MRRCKAISISALLLLISCSSYRPVENTGRINFDYLPVSEKKMFVSGKFTSYQRTEGIQSVRKIYFEMMDDQSPLAVMNNEAVEESFRGNYSTAIVIIDEALRDYPDSGALYNNKGCIAELTGKSGNAAECYFIAAKNNPENGYYFSNLNGLNHNISVIKKEEAPDDEIKNTPEK